MKYLLIVVLMMCSCSKQNDSHASKNQLRISFHSPVPTADPRVVSETLASALIHLIYEGLMRDSVDGNVELGLAEKIDISPDQKVYTFHLRPSVWSDGTPVTAHTFEKSWKQLLDPAIGSPSSYLFFYIKNGERAYNREVPPEEIGIRVLDDLTLEVTLEQPTSFFLCLTTLPSYRPIPYHVESQYKNWTSSATPFVSNGPFCLTKIDPHTELVLQKNSRFWNPKQVRIDQISIAIISNEHTNFQMFKNGELDWIGGNLSPLPIEELQQGSSHRVRNLPLGGVTFCSFNLQDPLLKNKNLRKALSFAINRNEIVEKITQMDEIPATRLIPPILTNGKEKSFYPAYDPELAQKHLQEALKELSLGPADLPSFVMILDHAALDTRVALALQKGWKDVLGIDVTLKSCETQVHWQALYRRDFQISLKWLLVQYADPMNVLERFEAPTHKKNYPGFDSPLYRKYVQKARATIDAEDRMRAYEQAEEAFLDEMPLAPMYHWTHHELSHPKVHDIEPAHNGLVLIDRAWLAS